MVRLNYNIFNSKESTFSIFFICLMAISCSTEEGTLYNKTRSSSSKISKNVQNTQDVISVENLEGEPGVDFEDKNGNLIPDNLEDGEWFEDVKPPSTPDSSSDLVTYINEENPQEIDGIVKGYVVDDNNSNSTFRVEIYINGPRGSGTKIAEVVANEDGGAADGQGDHSFSFELTESNSITEGQNYQIYTYVKDGGLVSGSPRRYTAFFPVGKDLYDDNKATFIQGCGQCHGFVASYSGLRAKARQANLRARATSGHARGASGGANRCNAVAGLCNLLDRFTDMVN